MYLHRADEEPEPGQTLELGPELTVVVDEVSSQLVRATVVPDTPSTPSPQRERAEACAPQQDARNPHLLKNGHPAHVLTTEDRRKGAERTNEIRRIRREAFEDEKFERAIELMIAKDEARRARRRARYERDRWKRKATATPAPPEPPELSYEEHCARIAAAQRAKGGPGF